MTLPTVVDSLVYEFKATVDPYCLSGSEGLDYYLRLWQSVGAIKMSLAQQGDVERIGSLLGIPLAPYVRAGVSLAISYYRHHLEIDPLEWVDYIRGIDFHSRVTLGYLNPGQRV